ncbi:hypothetical protein M422DRAFT_257551 [Sphaerobolus stellatus SS14]|uniref:Uncharacterized protein n=1 Tax=Sphaerobolus stellatus (strain SS14) TaxID=990650 RepID=A0A0C9VNQ8_SPHS4|nr:hypothetical protein M422DRAFT_257551 [Sphaerobolus stellatus SS14]
MGNMNIQLAAAITSIIVSKQAFVKLLTGPSKSIVVLREPPVPWANGSAPPGSAKLPPPGNRTPIINTHTSFKGSGSFQNIKGSEEFCVELTQWQYDFDNDNKPDDSDNKFGAGNYKLTVGVDSALNGSRIPLPPTPILIHLTRYYTAYAKSVFTTIFFVDGRVANGQLNMDVTRGFLQNVSVPAGFFRTNASAGLAAVGATVREVFAARPIDPGVNQGAINTFTLDPDLADFLDFVNITVPGLYPKPTGVLLNNLNTDLKFFFQPLTTHGCTQVSPFGNHNWR